MKRCTASQNFGVRQVKTTVRYHLTVEISYWRDHHFDNDHHQDIYKQEVLKWVWRKGNSPTLLVGQQLDKLLQPGWRTIWRFLKKLKIKLPYHPAIPVLGICAEKTITENDTCTPVFTAALLTIAKTWKQAKHPSVEDWVKKMWCIYTMDYYPAIKKDKIMPFATTWIDLEIVILKWSKSNREGQIQYDIIVYMWNLKTWYGWTCLQTEIESQI